MEDKKIIKISLNTAIIIICIVMIIIGVIVFIKFNTKTENESIVNPTTSEPISKKDNTEGYLVLDSEYDGEYDIAYFNISSKDSKKIKEFSLYSYAEYEYFCKKYNINQKFEEADKKYIVYYFTESPADSISAKLGNVEYNGNEVKLYIWDKVSYNGGIILDDWDQKAYAIIVPTDRDIKNYQIIPLMHKVEYNRMLGNSPMDGYSFSISDNQKIAVDKHINSDNKKLNNIINNSLDAIAKQHTIKVNTYIDNTDINLVSYMDLINSVFEIRGGTKVIQYIAYTTDMKINYVKYDSEYSDGYTYEDIIVDRDQILYDVFYEFGNDFLTNIDNYTINISEDDNNYIIDTKSSQEHFNSTYYINKETYLIVKTIRDNRTNEFSYTKDNIVLPNNIDVRTHPAVVDKPIIYLYPTEQMQVSVKLLNEKNLTCSYPKYKNGWFVEAEPNGRLKDLTSNRKLYSLYYESKSNIEFKVEDEGFVVKGEDTITFLEEKLSALGLTEIEAEEFIVYWLPKLEANKYNYIRFATTDEINENMPLEINPSPDTIIRVLMTFKGLDNPIEVQEQQLTTPERNGFVAVEWGGTEIK